MSSLRRKRGIENALVLEHEKRNCQKKIATDNLVVATFSDLKMYFKLLEDKVIAEFLQRDCCCKIIDKYLLAMVFVYFQRLRFVEQNFTRLNFFAALFLAHDMEEDDEEIKHEIFPWALGQNWRRQYPHFMSLRDKLWADMDHRAIVSRRCCDEVFSIDPGHHIWKRQRLSHHAGCYRGYLNPNSDYCNIPRGPNATPTACKECLLKHFSQMPVNSQILTMKNLFDRAQTPQFQCVGAGDSKDENERGPSRLQWSCED